MYSYPLYLRPYPTFYPPSPAQFQLASENRRLYTEVDILLSENRRLRTQILTKDLGQKYQINDDKLAYAGNAKLKQQRTQKKNTNSTTPNKTHKKIDSDRKYSSPYWSSEYTRRNLSEEKETNQRKVNERKSAPKYNYGVKNQPAIRQSIGKHTIIEELRSQGIQSSPPGIIRIITNKNEAESPRPFTIREQDEFISNNNGTNVSLDPLKRTNKIYLENYSYEQNKYPGAKLNRLSKIEEQKPATKPQKHFLTLFSKAYEGTKKEKDQNIKNSNEKVEDPQKKIQH